MWLSKVFTFILLIAVCTAQQGCSNIFTYAPDRSSGTFQLPGQVGRQTTTSIEIAVSAGNVNKHGGELKLSDNPNQTQRRLENNKPIKYTFRFPPASGNVIVTKISQGDKEYCYDDASEGNWRSFIEYSHTFHSIPGSTAKPTRKTATPLSANPVENRVSTPSGPQLPDYCGISGSDTAPTEQFDVKRWPWMASIRHVSNKEFHCTGTLITLRTVATAGHCFQETRRKEEPRDIIVYLGLNDASQNSGPNVQRSAVVGIHYYHGYRADTFENDFAVLILENPVSISDFIRPACIWPNPNNSSRDEIVNSYGYIGAFNSLVGVPSGAQVVRARLAEDEKCDANGITSRSVCIENVAQAIFCHGDSGAGIVYIRDGRWTLRGILSAGTTDRTSCVPNNYILFSDASPFWWWLRATLRDNYSEFIERQ